MQLVAALGVLHLAGVVSAVLRLEIRQHQLPGRQDLHVPGGIGTHLLRGALVPLSRRVSDRVARQSRRSPPRAHHVPAERRDPGRHSIRRHLTHHPRTLALAHPRATAHPELILDVLLQVGRLEERARRRQRFLAVIEFLSSVDDPVEFVLVPLSLSFSRKLSIYLRKHFCYTRSGYSLDSK